MLDMIDIGWILDDHWFIIIGCILVDYELNNDVTKVLMILILQITMPLKVKVKCYCDNTWVYITMI